MNRTIIAASIIFIVVCGICQGYCETASFRVLDGFPYTSFGDFYGNGAVADIDADGIKEYIAGDKSGYIYAVQSDGTSKPGFPVFAGDAIWSSPAIADIDNDGKAEIIIGSKNSLLNVIKFDGSLAKGFPFATTQEIRGAPSIADIDRNGTPDIIVAGLDGYLYVIDGTGKSLSGWPQRIVPNTENSQYNFDLGSRTTTLITDYDNDGFFEITVCANGGVFSIFKHNGERILSSKINARIDAPPAAADIDNDGIQEFIITAWDYNAYVFNIDSNGKIAYLQNYPYYFNALMRCHPAIYDFNGDGASDMIFFILTNYNKIQNPGQFLFLDNSAQLFSGFPNSDSAGVSCPVIANIDGDTEMEIIIATYNGEIQVYNYGMNKVKYHYYTPQKKIIESTPVINDFDNDGKMDIIAATEEKIITAITLDSPADYNSVCNSKFMFTLNNTGNNADFSTPLIYEPRNNLIHDTSVTFKWIQMENIIAPKSSYRINGSGYSEPDYVFEKTFGGLLDGEYIFQVEQSFRDKKSMTPAYRKIIIDNKMPCAILDKNINYGGGVINFTGSASDSNFYYYNFKIFTLSGNTVLDTDIFQPVDSGIIYSFNSLNFPDDTYTAELSVFETDSVYFSTDSVSFSFKNDTMKISSNKYSVFTSDNGNLKLDFPLKAADIPLDIVVYKTIASFNGPGLIFVSDKYKIEFDDSLIAKKFMITVKVSESVFAPAIKKALKSSSGVSGDFSILFNNGRDSAWLNLGGYYDSINNTITSSFNRSGIYAAAMNPPVSLEVITSSLSLNKRVIEFDGDEISVLNINGSAEISVFDLNGKLMFSDRTNKWNGKNKNGKKVPAGLYALFCKDNSGVLKKTIYVK